MSNQPELVAPLGQQEDYPISGQPVHELPEEPTIQAVPVYLVEGEDTPEIRDVRLTNYPVGSDGVQIGAQEPDRIRIYIRNTDAAKVVYLTTERTEQAFGGFPLNAGADIELTTEMPVYARTQGADIVTIGVLEEIFIREED